MISLLPPPQNSRDVAIKAHPFRFVSKVKSARANEAKIPLPECLKKAVTLMVDTFDGQLWLSEVSEVTLTLASYLDLEPVADYAAAHARSLKMGRPLLDKIAIEEAIQTVRKKHGTGECDACGKEVAISDLTPHEKTVTPPAKVCPDCHEEKGCPFDENVKQITTVPFSISPPKPTDPNREWSLFSIRPGAELLETPNLTCHEAMRLQLADIHNGATWTAVFRTEKRFMILSDTDGEPPYESEAWAKELNTRMLFTAAAKKNS